MTRLILVRHGQSTGNLTHVVTGQDDYPLSETGHTQAKKAAAWLVAHEKITKIYASDLSRAYDTAAPTAEALSLPILRDPSLREMDMGALVGLTKGEWAERFPDNWRSWTADYIHYRAPEGESIPELYARAVGAVTGIAAENEGECVAVFCHMGVMRSFEAYARGLSCDEIESVPGGSNASLAIYTYEGGTVTPVAYDLCEHLAQTVTKTADGLL